MTGRHRRLVRIPPAAWAGLVTAGVVVAVTAVLVTRPGPAPEATLTPAPSTPSWAPAPAEDSTPVARPVRIRIPSINVDAPVVDIGLDAAGALAPPETADRVGWFTGGAAPGAVGPALLAGHVDSRAGPGVFFHLVELRAGNPITVLREDGSSVTFSVVSTARVAKTAFPTDLIYAPVPVPMLRLITCGGTFDRSVRSYRDNVIVEAAPQQEL